MAKTKNGKPPATDKSTSLELRVKELEKTVEHITDNLNAVIKGLNKVQCTCADPPGTCRVYKSSSERTKP